ncbi:hypothetical protein CHS0354_020417, partial [Potamilus streckersoni]
DFLSGAALAILYLCQTSNQKEWSCVGHIVLVSTSDPKNTSSNLARPDRARCIREIFYSSCLKHNITFHMLT